jgi:hypothetical protein
VDDIFGDYAALKRLVKKGFVATKPEKISRIYFDIKFIVNG